LKIRFKSKFAVMISWLSVIDYCFKKQKVQRMLHHAFSG